MSDIETRAEKTTSSILNKQAKGTSRVLTAVSGGEKTVTSRIKTGIKTAKAINTYYKGERIKAGITGEKPTLKTGVKHYVKTKVDKGKAAVADTKIAVYKAAAGDYKPLAKGTVKVVGKTAKISSKASAKVLKSQSRISTLASSENSTKYIENRITEKEKRAVTKLVSKPINKYVIKPINKAAKNTIKKTSKFIFDVIKRSISLIVKMLSHVAIPIITAVTSLPIIFIPIIVCMLTITILASSGGSQSIVPITPSEGWTFPTAENRGINAGTWNYPRSFGGREHLGIDLAVSSGTPLLAVANGYILRASDGCRFGYFGSTCAGAGGARGGGNMVMLLSVVGDNLYAIKYCHMQPSLPVHTGDILNAGDTVGYAGSTGNSTGTHCHIEIAWVGLSSDYENYINTWNGDWSNGAGWQGNNRKCSDSVSYPCRIRPETVFGLE